MAKKDAIREFGERDSKIEIPAGSSFSIELPGRGGAAYLWQVAEQPPFIKLKGEQRPEPPNDVQGPTPQIFTFEANAKGSGKLRFELTRMFGKAHVEDTRETTILAT